MVDRNAQRYYSTTQSQIRKPFFLFGSHQVKSKNQYYGQEENQLGEKKYENLHGYSLSLFRL